MFVSLGHVMVLALDTSRVSLMPTIGPEAGQQFSLAGLLQVFIIFVVVSSLELMIFIIIIISQGISLL